ncbi:MAG: hypothetical protein LW850_29140 [Planctomycetaceae bacterium]|jgi:hypothetical protein|nr:hypothetical protein [Planctomycetaceae bacterium]MCE2814471.1 hypothetical protein [Planctomycetaceae bacterium]
MSLAENLQISNCSKLVENRGRAHDSSNNALDIDLVRGVSPLFRIESRRADQIIDQVRDAVSNWRQIATELEISRMQQNSMARAFSALFV